MTIIFQKSKLSKTLYISTTPTPFQIYCWGGSGPIGGCIGILFASESSNSLVDKWCEASGGDSDIDSICDSVDNCLNSDMNVKLIIDECDTNVANIGNSEGCTLSDLINECANNFRNHGELVSCVTHLTNDWKADNLILDNEKGVIQSCASQA